MSKNKGVWGLLALVGGVTLTALPVSAQMSRETLESLDVLPTAHAINRSVNFANVGTSDVWTATGYATSQTGQSSDGEDPRNMAYVRYTAPAGSKVRVTPTFGSSVPAPTADSDACAHAHNEFAIYGIMKTKIGFLTTSRAVFMGSSGQYGRRMKNGVEVPWKTAGASCVVSAVTGNTSVPGYTWGQDSYDIPFVKPNAMVTLTEFIIPAQAATHGWGDCGNFLCFPSVRYTATRIQ